MNCQEVVSTIANTPVGDLPTEIRAQMDLHLRGCRRCAKLVRAQKLSRLEVLLRTKGGQKPRINWRQYEKRLFDRLAEDRRKELGGKRPATHLLRPAYAAAASLLLAVSMFVAGRLSVSSRNGVETKVTRTATDETARYSISRRPTVLVTLHVEDGPEKTDDVEDQDIVIVGGLIHDSFPLLQ